MVKHIALSQNKTALVDDDDYERLSQFKWHARHYIKCGTDYWYAATNVVSSRTGRRTILLMHKFLVSSEKSVDHCDGNGLNNQKTNLRACDQSKNTANSKLSVASTSGFKGVSWQRRRKSWRAYIVVNYKQHHIGTFKTAEEAAKARDIAAIHYFGDFARLNFPRSV